MNIPDYWPRLAYFWRETCDRILRNIWGSPINFPLSLAIYGDSGGFLVQIILRIPHSFASFLNCSIRFIQTVLICLRICKYTLNLANSSKKKFAQIPKGIQHVLLLFMHIVCHFKEDLSLRSRGLSPRNNSPQNCGWLIGRIFTQLDSFSSDNFYSLKYCYHS